MMHFINEDPETNALVSKVSIDEGRHLLKIKSSETMRLSQQLRWGGVKNELNAESPDKIVDIPLLQMRNALCYLLEMNHISPSFFEKIQKTVRNRER